MEALLLFIGCAAEQVEDRTPFAKRYTAGDKPLPSAEDAAAMYRAASYVLTGAGFEHYEISNFAKPGHRWAPACCEPKSQCQGYTSVSPSLKEPGVEDSCIIRRTILPYPSSIKQKLSGPLLALPGCITGKRSGCLNGTCPACRCQHNEVYW